MDNKENNSSLQEKHLLEKSPKDMTHEELVKIATLYQEEKRKSESRNKQNKKKKKKEQVIDWSTQTYRHIALKIAYLGFNYQGLSKQLHTPNTIEHHLFEALKTLKLIEHEDNCEFTKCGRTDKGVSALGQVVSFNCRYNPKKNDYVRLINSLLPDDIRVLAWCPVSKDFDARFGCLQRTYKYYFIRQNLNIEKMKQAAAHFVGEHDFRNFCKINEEVTNFRRRILSMEIIKSDLLHQQHGNDEYFEIYEIVVCGTSFLWHQVRCMTAILFLIGEGKEEPSVIPELLDIEKYKARPVYHIASEFPLVLYDCVFEDLKWIHTNDMISSQADLTNHFYEMWRSSSLKSTMYNIFYQAANNTLVDNSNTFGKDLNTNVDSNTEDATRKYTTVKKAVKAMKPIQRGPKYVKLLERPRAFSLEECVESSKKKRKQ